MKPRVGLTLLISSPIILFTMVVFPALSRPLKGQFQKGNRAYGILTASVCASPCPLIALFLILTALLPVRWSNAKCKYGWQHAHEAIKSLGQATGVTWHWFKPLFSTRQFADPEFHEVLLYTPSLCSIPTVKCWSRYVVPLSLSSVPTRVSIHHGILQSQQPVSEALFFSFLCW